MFPRIINSHFSTGQEVHSWSPVLPALLLCPCCPATAAQPRLCPASFTAATAPAACGPGGHGGHRIPTGTRCPRGQRGGHDFQAEPQGGLHSPGPAVTSARWDVMLKGGSEAGQQPVVQSVWELALLVCQLRGSTGWEESSGVFHSISSKGSTPSMGSSNSSRDNTLPSPRVGHLV